VVSDEVDVIDAWFAHLDLRGERKRKRAPAWTWAWGILGSVVAAIILTFWLGIPWLAGIVAQQVPMQWEKDLAGGTLSELAGMGFKATEVPAQEQARLQILFADVAKRTTYRLPITLEFRSWDQPNALAIPGGVVVITDQMLDLMQSDDEFTAVMAHEVGHLEYRHGVRTVLQNSSSMLVLSLLVGDVSGLSVLAAAMPALLVNSAYSRDFEREADQYAFTTLRAMGKSPRAFADVMGRLEAASDTAGGMPYFSSHPPTSERIEAAERAAR
jgi:Zn-dependent protease with chaperone function